MKIPKNSNNDASTKSENIKDKAYSDAIDYIKSAISSLSSVADEDSVAKESIANLSVVLLDLK